MSEGLRQRNTAAMTTVANDGDDGIMGSRSGLSAASLRKASPTQTGTVLKLHVPLIYGLSPDCLKQVISSQWFPCVSFRPQWKERQLVLLGKFLYRFSDENSSSPKGAPIEVDLVQSRLVGHDSEENDWYGIDVALQNLPPGCEGVFTVSTFGKTRYFAVSSKEEAMTWVQSLQQARQESITRSMGHAGHVPYPKNWDYFDRLGDKLKKRKERIKQTLEKTNMREMEMSSLGEGAGSSMPRSYYG